ncbi:MAG: hypothetical protein ABEJ65_01340, partial [bacterium]
ELRQFTRTSPRENVLDFLLTTLTPDELQSVTNNLSKKQPLVVAFNFQPKWNQQPGEHLQTSLILEGGNTVRR